MSDKDLISRFFMEKIKQIHIGNLIQEVVSRKGIKISWLAGQLGCHRNNIYLIYARSWIDTETLMKLSLILCHDFFADLSEHLKSQHLQRVNRQNTKIL